nr:3-deoxy-7-phosphoheptulonate synthase [uncultured bacterium]
MAALQNIHVRGFVPLVAPRDLKAQLPVTPHCEQVLTTSREAIGAILEGRDRRLILVVGPCSIHDEAAALEYAGRLAELARSTADRLLIVMRVYFEKPRTTIGWKGLINDPHMDGTFDIAEGLSRARTLLLQVTGLGLPAATEMLDPITPQYAADLISWASVGARTTESQTHRQMASGLSMPVGFKNGTDGDLQVALDAIEASRHPHSFLGIDDDGQTCIVQTSGNPQGHLILRGGRSGANYEAPAVEAASRRLEKAGLPPGLIIDCSHANSNKDYRQQGLVFRNVVEQRARGNRNIIGLMLESHLVEGKQPLTSDPSQLRYGVSITDGCIGWEETARLIEQAYEALACEQSTIQ